MELADLVLELLPRLDRGAVIAFVGAGGKTTGMYALAGELAARGARVLATTTTMIYDPRREGRGGLDRVEIAAELGPGAEGAPATGELSARSASATAAAAAARRVGALAEAGRVALLASAELPAEGKLRGIRPDSLRELAEFFDYLLVEADGARRLPIKAPGPREPALPFCLDLVVGCVGLDCLGAAVGPETVHRHELFGRLVGASPGGAIGTAELAALVASDAGLFKSAPPGARRLVALNKAELVPPETLAAVLEGLAEDHRCVADAVAACRFAADSDRVLALRRGAARRGCAEVY